MTEKERAYKKYIKEHIKNVKDVYKELKSWCYFFDTTITDKIIKKHDKSKYSAEEFEHYRQFFFPENNDNKSKDIMNIGWNHHQKINPHHWQYWLMYEDKRTKALDMPLPYIVEMLCDWGGMSLKFKNSPTSWFEENKESMLLSENTLYYVYLLLPYIETSCEEIQLKRTK